VAYAVYFSLLCENIKILSHRDHCSNESIVAAGAFVPHALQVCKKGGKSW